MGWSQVDREVVRVRLKKLYVFCGREIEFVIYAHLDPVNSESRPPGIGCFFSPAIITY